MYEKDFIMIVILYIPYKVIILFLVEYHIWVSFIITGFVEHGSSVMFVNKRIV
jgi:hypothetical protein